MADILEHGGDGESAGQTVTGETGDTTQTTTDQTTTTTTGEGELPKWHGVLPKAYQGHESLKGVEGMEQLLEGFVGLKATEGKVFVPDKDSSDDVKAAFFKELGVPDKSAEYTIDKVDVPEGIGFTGEIRDEYRQLFHNLKLSQGQANKLFKAHMSIETEMFKAKQAEADKATEKAIDTLKTEYGADYDKNVSIATKALKEYMSEDAFTRLKDKGFTSDPDVVEMFYRVGKTIIDDSVLTGTGAKSKGERPKDGQGRSTFDFSATTAKG